MRGALPARGRLEGSVAVSVAQVLPPGNDPRHDRHFSGIADQGCDQIELVHGDELQDLTGHRQALGTVGGCEPDSLVVGFQPCVGEATNSPLPIVPDQGDQFAEILVQLDYSSQGTRHLGERLFGALSLGDELYQSGARDAIPSFRLLSMHQGNLVDVCHRGYSLPQRS